MRRRALGMTAAVALVVGLVLTVSALPAMAKGSNNGGSHGSWNPSSWNWWWGEDTHHNGNGHDNGKGHDKGKGNGHHKGGVNNGAAVRCAKQLLAPETSGADFTQTITNAVDNGDGTVTISYAYTTTRPDGVYRLTDCAFNDTADNGTYNAFLDPIVGATNQQVVSVQNGGGSSSITVFADENDVVCTRLAMRGAGPAFLDRSNVACIDLAEAEVPIGAIGGVGLIGLSTGLFGIAYLVNRRKVRRLRAQANGASA